MLVLLFQTRQQTEIKQSRAGIQQGFEQQAKFIWIYACKQTVPSKNQHRCALVYLTIHCKHEIKTNMLTAMAGVGLYCRGTEIIKRTNMEGRLHDFI